MKFSMTGQEKGDKGDLLIEVTFWAGLTVYVQCNCCNSFLFCFLFLCNCILFSNDDLFIS